MGGVTVESEPTPFLDARRLDLGPWPAFERVIARFLQHGGYNDVKVVGGSGDQGADIVATRGLWRYVIQAKFKSAGLTGHKGIDEVVRAMGVYQANCGIAVTNLGFAPIARGAQQRWKRAGFDVRIWGRDFLLKYAGELPFDSAARRALRPYQGDALEAINAVRQTGGTRALVTLATGLGKTVVASSAIASFLEQYPEKAVLVMAHTKELVRQLEFACWPQFNAYTHTHLWTDGEVPAYEGGVTFATWQSVRSALDRGYPIESKYEMVVVDEAHHAPSTSFGGLLMALEPEFMLGLTATPWRADGESLRDWFGDPVFSMDIVSGMQRGYLAEVDYRMMLDGIDWEEIRDLSRQGLTVKDLNQYLLVPERDRGIVRAVHEEASILDGPRILVFCRSIGHAEQLVGYFREFDMPARPIHSQLSREEQFTNLADFRTGKLSVLISIEMLNEGIDVPEVNMVVFARVTHSRRIFIQQLGRGLRLSEGKERVRVLDFVADIRRISAGMELNRQGREAALEIETVRYPGGKIVEFSGESLEFFEEFLGDIGDIEDLSDDSRLVFPVP